MMKRGRSAGTLSFRGKVLRPRDGDRAKSAREVANDHALHRLGPSGVLGSICPVTHARHQPTTCHQSTSELGRHSAATRKRTSREQVERSRMPSTGQSPGDSESIYKAGRWDGDGMLPNWLLWLATKMTGAGKVGIFCRPITSILEKYVAVTTWQEQQNGDCASVHQPKSGAYLEKDFDKMKGHSFPERVQDCQVYEN